MCVTSASVDDLISWPSGSAQQESDNNTDFDAMKTQLKELYLQKVSVHFDLWLDDMTIL